MDTWTEMSFVLYMTNWTLPNTADCNRIATTGVLHCNLLALHNSSNSYFFEEHSKTCIIQSSIIYSTDTLVPNPGTKYFVQNGPRCGLAPTTLNGRLISVDNETAQYICNDGRSAVINCKDYTWIYRKGSFCTDLHTCADIKLCNPSYTSDQEYWIYPALSSTTRARVYCKGMATGNPIEYITLVKTNVFSFPNQKYTSICSLVAQSGAWRGKTRYKKIRINPKTLVVNVVDKSFIQHIWGYKRQYFEGRGCSYRRTCALRGHSVSDLTGTGFIFGPNIEWHVVGTSHRLNVITNTSHRIEVKVDGSCGDFKLRTKDSLQLQLDPSYSPDWDSAIDPNCT